MNTIYDEMGKQSNEVKPQNFVCSSCVYYQGGCGCLKGIFIAYEGANLTHCSYYKEGFRCPHCGKIR